MCKIANISRSGYYKWIKNKDKKDKDFEDYLLVKQIFENGKRKYGWRRIRMELESMGIIMNHKKIIRIMNKYNLKAEIRRKNPYKNISKKTEEHRTFENILNRKFNQLLPRKTFCTDITYLFYGYGKKAYLSAIKDIASKEIVGWKLSNHIEIELALNTLDNMTNNLKLNSFKDILIHSDQGVHYTNPLYIGKVKNLNMVQSMSRKGNCLDNASIESFFGHFKDEVDYKKCKTLEELKEIVNNYINYYNNERRQWNIQKMTPVMYRDHLLSPN